MARNADQTQQRLIDSAAVMIAAQGIAGLRVDEVAKHAQINKRMIYHYFGSKNGLWLRVLEQSVEYLCASVSELSDEAKNFLQAEFVVSSQAPKPDKAASVTAPTLQRAAQVILRRFLDGPVVISGLQDADWRVLCLTLCRLAFSEPIHSRYISVSEDLHTATLSTKPRYQLRPSFRIE